MTKFIPMKDPFKTMLIRQVLAHLLIFVGLGVGQTDTAYVFPDFDSHLLKLKVPDAFHRSSLKLEVFADSSWQLYRGEEAIDFAASMELLGQKQLMADYQAHLKNETEYIKAYRSRRIFAMISSLGGAVYLSFTWKQGWVYHIPGYAAILVGGIRYYESKKLEIQALREQYYLRALMEPARVQKLVDDYNFRLYQYLSTAGIQFSDS